MLCYFISAEVGKREKLRYKQYEIKVHSGQNNRIGDSSPGNCYIILIHTISHWSNISAVKIYCIRLIDVGICSHVERQSFGVDKPLEECHRLAVYNSSNFVWIS